MTIFYKAIYTWTDAQGNIHRSAPSAQLQVQSTAANTSFTNASIAVPTLSLTDKGASTVNIELYKTAVDGTTFYHATTVDNFTSPRPNDEGADWVVIYDAMSDTDLQSQEFLYTTGGILDNIPAVSNSAVASFKNRLFIGGLEDKFEKVVKFEKVKGFSRTV